MLKRKIVEKLELWWKGKTALFVDGARQVGKTYTLETFAKSKSNSYVYVNFVERADAIPQIIRSKDAKSFLFNLSSIIDHPLIKGETIIFLDEIQSIYIYMDEHKIPRSEFDLVTLMKFLVMDGSYRFILSGSLLGVALTDILSWPTGYMTSFTMYPLDFEEFLWANGVNDDVIDHVKNCFFKKTTVDEFIHAKFMDLFRKYVLIGGMPAAVQSYVDHNDLNMVALEHQNIEMYNRRDISKYAPKDKKLYILQIYDAIPEELDKKNKRFTLGPLENKNNHDIVEDSFLWLVNAGVAIPAYTTDEPTIPLKIGINRRLLKLFHEDSGLLTYLYMDPLVKNKILNDEKNINFGAIYENVVADLLKTHGFDYLYYYNNKKNGEVDFLVEWQGDVLPIEVKSGKDFEKHSALDNLLSNKGYSIPTAFIFNNGNVKMKENKIYLPIYMADLIKRGL
ncbi:MAG: ATP-binding protein [Bacilli bacterium]|jgi:predicted AAA+ superfamily ATPase|nr:ATP-binding protein [Bacilli bacterium]